MAFKFIILSALVATVANAGLLPVAYHHSYAAAPLAYAHAAPVAVHTKVIEPEHYSHPQYSYGYGVHDAHTGDIKSHHESRDGDVVKGSYSLVEADGSKRTVDYTADHHHGFNAVVHKTPAAHPVAIKTVAIKTVAAPALSYHAEPAVHYAYAHHAAPAISYAAAAPAWQYAHHGPSVHVQSAHIAHHHQW